MPRAWLRGLQGRVHAFGCCDLQGWEAMDVHLQAGLGVVTEYVGYHLDWRSA